MTVLIDRRWRKIEAVYIICVYRRLPKKIMETSEDKRSKYISSITDIQSKLLKIRREITEENIEITRLKDPNIYLKLKALASKARAEGYEYGREEEAEFILLCRRNVELRRIIEAK